MTTWTLYPDGMVRRADPDAQFFPDAASQQEAQVAYQDFLAAGGVATPIGEIASAPVTVLYRSDLFRRCTEDEADKIDAALASTSTRMRNLFASVVTLRSDAPEWQTLHDAAVQLFGTARAAELLAPSA